MRKSLILMTVLFSGCTTLDYAGHDSYTLKSFTAPLGQVGCCEFEAKSGKEYAGRTITFQSNGSTTMLQIMEGESKAFKGQGIAGKVASPLPLAIGDFLK